ncbi:hypothetical protein ACFCYB_37925 [Streptomyces sp. NPDC056309]|uniref:LexA family protein n=1 Tax=unclassified Streptomyces TaxID=2593676 RepID=UPI0035DA2E19
MLSRLRVGRAAAPPVAVTPGEWETLSLFQPHAEPGEVQREDGFDQVCDLVGAAPREEEILRCIRRWIEDKGEGPSVRQFAHAVGMRSTASVAYHLANSERSGALV